jgi:hypothetical protein
MTPLQTILNGSLGALSFGMWWHYVSMRQIKEHNKNIDKMEEYTSWW